MKNWTAEIDQITESFLNSFGTLTSEQLNWKQEPDEWSIAQNVDHLIVINKTYFPVVESIRNGTYELPFIAKLGFLVSFLGNAVLKGVQPDRKKKIKTFPIWEPDHGQISNGILNQFKTHQEELKNLIAGSADLVASGTIISSPASRNIVYKLETAFDIIVTHEKRHFEQSKEILQQMKA